MNGTKIVPLDAALAGAETPAVVPLSTAAVPTDGGDVLVLGQGVGVPGVPALSLSVELSENAPRLSKIASRPNGAFLAVADMLHRGIGPALLLAEQQLTSTAASRSSDEAAAVLGSPTPLPLQVKALAAADFVRTRKALEIGEMGFRASVSMEEGAAASDFRCIAAGDAPGKSASSFFFTADQAYVFKSCTKKDTACLLKLLPKYLAYVEGHEATLLPRYVGLFELATGEVFVCMTNVFGGKFEVHHRYDLKGSTYGRRASAKERAKPKPVLKDLDWIAEGRTLAFGASGPQQSSSSTKHHMAYGDFLPCIRADARFLSDSGLLDYSLLVGVHVRDHTTPGMYHEASPDTWHRPGTVVLDDGRQQLYTCIVDILTPYSTKKKLETFFTGTLTCGRDVSCQPPRKYAERFVTFVTGITQQTAGEGGAGKAATGTGEEAMFAVLPGFSGPGSGGGSASKPSSGSMDGGAASEPGGSGGTDT